MAITHQRRARLSIDVPRKARRRIRIAAAKRDKSIREYVWEAVEARLKHDLADELSAADPVPLNERADPVLAALWDNPKDAAFDKCFSRGDIVLVKVEFFSLQSSVTRRVPRTVLARSRRRADGDQT